MIFEKKCYEVFLNRKICFFVYFFDTTVSFDYSVQEKNFQQEI